MTELPIPEYVLDALAAVRETNATNMFDRRRVAELVAVTDPAAAEWVRSANPRDYLRALMEMGARENQ